MPGYYKDPKRTKESLLKMDGLRQMILPILTKGRYYLRGRLNNDCLSFGENIYPEEIESVINDIEGVNESIVLARKGKLVALIQLNDNIIDWGWRVKQVFEN